MCRKLNPHYSGVGTYWEVFGSWDWSPQEWFNVMGVRKLLSLKVVVETAAYTLSLPHVFACPSAFLPSDKEYESPH